MSDRPATDWHLVLIRIVNLLALACLIAWILYAATGQNVFGERTWPETVVDYRILYEMSRQVVEDGQYPSWPFFPYPPSAVVLLYPPTFLPFHEAAAAWVMLCVAATLATLICGSALVGLAGHPWRWPAALAAFAALNYYVLWDLRSLNCNMLYCVLLLLALVALKNGWDIPAGLFLAASVALKLYPVLVVGYLLWIGRRRAFVATLGFLTFFFGLLPLIVFGPEGMVTAYSSWATQLRSAAATLHEADHPILISLAFTLAKRLGSYIILVQALTLGATLIWLAAVLRCVLAGGARGRPVTGWDLAVDGGVLVLAPVVISPYLEPYHVVPALLPALAIMQHAADGRQHWRTRVLAGAALAVSWLALAALAECGLTGVGVFMQMILMVVALTAIRRTRATAAMARPTCPEGAKHASPGQRPGDRCLIAKVEP